MPKDNIVNPPDIAIALLYDGDNAPEVVATGKGKNAQRIIDIAEENNIPMQGDPSLANLLCDVPLGEEIPESLYLAVAKILAFAYLVSGKYDTER